ncbi:MAG: hypothetical protein AABX02_03655 [archaeon]
MKTRGFVIAIDALLSLIILFSMIGLAFSAFDHSGGEWNERFRLSSFAHHAGVTLESSSYLSRAVTLDSTTGVQSFLDSFPQNMCGSVAVYPSPDTNTADFIVSKNGCSSITGESEVVSQGFMVASPPDVNLYVARITVWVNQG